MRILRADTVVRAIIPGSPADRAGVVPGDRVDVAALGVPGHLLLMNPRIGEQLSFAIRHDGTARNLALTAVPTRTSPLLRWLMLGEFLSTAAFIVVGATLVYLRPSPMTWWLWLFCVGIVPVNQLLDFYALFVPRNVYAGVWLFGRVFLGGFSAFPLLPFVLRFPYERISGWRVRLRPWLIAFVGALFVYYIAIAWLGLQRGLVHYSLFNGLPALALYLVAAVLITATYLKAHGLERERLKWAVTGMLIAFAAQICQYVPGPNWLAPLTELVSIVMPICVAYAVLRQRLIDVDFVINRAIVYAMLATILLAFVSLLDWFTSRFIEEYHLALYSEAAATIAMGFVLDRLHTHLEGFTERIFFRARHEAEEHLARVARSLGFASRMESIEEALIDQPLSTLHLASAALFCHDATRPAFVRTYSSGWAGDDLHEFPDDAPAVRYMRADHNALVAGEADLPAADLPHGAAAPALVVPIFCRDELHAIAIYGAHANSTGLDPSEIALLTSLAPGAGLAFDHLTYDQLRRQLAEATRLPTFSTPRPT